MEDVEDKRKVPVKVLWALAAGTAVLLLLWLTGVLDRQEGAETTAAKSGVVGLRPQIHALQPVIVKLKPLIEKDPGQSSEPDEE